MHRQPTIATLLAVAALAWTCHAAEAWQPLAEWRIAAGRIAPWAGADVRVDERYQGKAVRFEAQRVTAPHPLACDSGTQYEWLVSGPEGLFEGNLPAPQADAARQLGLDGERIATLRVGCPNASFDFHRTAGGELLLGLDNVVWTLRAAQAARTPEEIVQELLVGHFTHDMAFTPASVALKATYLSAGLRTRIAAWFALPTSPDEVPTIDGDPFTDTQEYPDRFTLDTSRTQAARQVVPVHFADDNTRRRVDYLLVIEGGRWVVDDVIDERGVALQTLLGEPVGP